jgi:HAE1 family hydrophobic/amphiphilic exporter-1
VLKTDEFPDVQAPVVVVSCYLPGAAPERRAEVIEPVETPSRGSAAQPDQSSALDSFGLPIEFTYEKDLQEATSRSATRSDHPAIAAEMEEPSDGSTRRLPIVSMTLSSKREGGLTLLADSGITVSAGIRAWRRSGGRWIERS